MKFPIGIQSFERIIQEGYIYVDKTDIIYDLTHNGSIYFLSRPRRFGKSLLVSTLENYYSGRKELFRGLAIEKMETEWNEYPVFHVDFNATNFTNPGELEKKLNFYLAEWEQKYNLPVRENELGLGDRFIKVLNTTNLFLMYWMWIPIWKTNIAIFLKLFIPCLRERTNTCSLYF